MAATGSPSAQAARPVPRRRWADRQLKHAISTTANADPAPHPPPPPPPDDAGAASGGPETPLLTVRENVRVVVVRPSDTRMLMVDVPFSPIGVMARVQLAPLPSSLR